jgi:dTDP-glucose 4,6-dehydratase
MDSDVETPVNLGNPDERTILNLAEQVVEITESDSEITHEPLPPQDPQVRKPDIAKAKTELDWEPTVSLEEGLRRSIPYFQRQL